MIMMDINDSIQFDYVASQKRRKVWDKIIHYITSAVGENIFCLLKTDYTDFT